MRKVILVLFFFSLPSTLWASDPIIGTWKSNIEKSSLLADEQDLKLKEETVVCREIEEDLIEVTINSVWKDGSQNSTKWTFPRQGGVAKCISGTIPEERLYIATLVEAGNWYASIMVNGRQVNMYHLIVSKDGKTMRNTLTGFDKEGKPRDIIWVFEKQ